MIGDKTSDIGAGLKSNLKTVLVKTGYGLKDMERQIKMKLQFAKI